MFVSEHENIELKNILIPLFENLRTNGGKEILSFSGFEEEYEALRYGVGVKIFEPSYFELEGEETLNFLQRLVTRDVSEASDEKKISALFLNERGGVIDRVRIFKNGKKFVIIGNKIYERKVSLWLQRYLLDERIEINIRNDFVILELLGMQADSFVGLITNENIDSDGLTIFKQVVGDFSYLFIKDLSVWGIPKYRVLIEKRFLRKFIDFLIENKSVFNLKFVGEDAYEVFRIEHGIPKAPNEINDSFLPLQLNLQNEIDFSKTNFIGFEFVLKKNSPLSTKKRNLGIVVFEKPPDFTLPAEISKEGEELGIVTSKVFSPLVKKEIGLGVFNEEEIERENSYFEAEVGDEKLKIKIQSAPLKR